MFHTVVQQGFQELAKYICFANNLWLFPTMKEFSELVNSWWSYCKTFAATCFLQTQCTNHLIHFSVAHRWDEPYCMAL